MIKTCRRIALAGVLALCWSGGTAQGRSLDRYRVREVKGPLGIHFVWVPGGVFLDGTWLVGKTWHGMGTRRLNRPRLLSIKGFWLSTTLVTNHEFLKFARRPHHDFRAAPSFSLPKNYPLGDNTDLVGGWPSEKFLAQFSRPSLRRWRGADLPVTCVSLADARAFCRWLSRLAGRKYYVPHIYQLQRAAMLGYPRAGHTALVAFQRSHNWIAANSGGHPHSVSSKDPDVMGLHDMLGNVTEWTATPIPAYLDRGILAHFHPYLIFGVDYAYKPRLVTDRRWAAAAFTLQPPGAREENLGFRIACSGAAPPEAATGRAPRQNRKPSSR